MLKKDWKAKSPGSKDFKVRRMTLGVVDSFFFSYSQLKAKSVGVSVYSSSECWIIVQKADSKQEGDYALKPLETPQKKHQYDILIFLKEHHSAGDL